MPAEPAPLTRPFVLRTVLFVLGVLLIELAFVSSYAGGLHAPEIRPVPVGVVGAPAQRAQLTSALAARHAPVRLRSFPTARAAGSAVRHGQVAGALVIDPSHPRLLVASAAGPAVETVVTDVFTRVARALHVPLAVDDVVPLPAGNSRGLVQFYLVVGLVIGGYLLATVLGLGGGMTPRTFRRGLLRLGVLAAFSVVSGVLALLVVDAGFHYQAGGAVAAAAVAALVVFASGALAAAVMSALGIVGTGVVILLLVVVGNPSAGGAWPNVLLASPWREVGPWLPNGAGLDALRAAVFFDGYGARAPVLVLAGYAAAGVVATLLLSWRGRGLLTVGQISGDSELAGIGA